MSVTKVHLKICDDKDINHNDNSKMTKLGAHNPMQTEILPFMCSILSIN